jgi:fibronectin type 3 domain-containing protein
MIRTLRSFLIGFSILLLDIPSASSQIFESRYPILNEAQTTEVGFRAYARYIATVGGCHTGVDIGPLEENTAVPISNVNYGKISTKYVNGFGDHNFGNTAIVEYLKQDGSYMYMLYGHMQPFDLNEGDYLSKKQIIANMGGSGNGSPIYWDRHLHFEINLEDGNNENGYISASYGATNRDCVLGTDSAHPGNYDYSSPRDYLDNQEVLVPLLSHLNIPNQENYSVYGEVNKTLNGTLNIDAVDIDKVGILVRRTNLRTNATDGSFSAAPKFLASSETNFQNISGASAAYTKGDYLFLGFVSDEGASRYGYPLKFAIVENGDVVVDNDQIDDGDYSYTSLVPRGLTSSSVPGYFLTADLYNGASDVSARWNPNVEGDFKMFAHIPEAGPTATEVVYELTISTTETIVSKPIDQTNNRGEWVELVFDVQDAIALKRHNYVELSLTANGVNASTRPAAKVALDAIKFQKIDFAQIPNPVLAPLASDLGASDHVAITWGHVTNASYYEVVRCNAIGFEVCSPIGTSLTRSFSDYNLGGGDSYKYGVKACNALGCSARSQLDVGSIPNSCDPANQSELVGSSTAKFNSASACSAPPRVSGLQASDGTFTNKIALAWDNSSSANSYKIYRCAVTFSGACAFYKSSNSNFFDDIAVEPGTEYFYQIKACIDSLCSTEYSEPDSGYRSAASSINSMRLISENVPDGTIFAGGQNFTKSWTVRNNGSSTWDSSYCLRYFTGEGLVLGQSSCVSGLIAPNETFTFVVGMKAPSAIANDVLYRDYWRMHGATNQVFSGNIWAEILVEGVAPTANTPDFSAVSVNASTIQLSWTQDNSGIDYRLYRASSANGSFQLLRQLSTLGFTDDNLTPSTIYYYRLQRCVDSSLTSCSSFSATKSATTQAPAASSTLISAFTNSKSSPVLGSTVSLSATVGNGGGIAKNDRFQFVFAVSDNTSLGNTDIILLAVPTSGNFTLAAGASDNYSKSYRIPDDATPGSKYFLACMLYRDPADQLQQYCQPSVVTFVLEAVQVPSTPNKPTLNYQQGATQIAAEWNGSSGGGFYRLERSISDSGGFSEVHAGAGFSYVNSGISNGTTYYYRLRSCQNSLASTCSGYSASASVTTLATATNDFTAQSIKVSRQGSDITIEAGQKYAGTSTSLVYPVMGFYLSSDTVCSTSNDIFLGSETSGISINDIVDVEEITVSYPSQANSGTWYACAIADHNNQISESNENNNSISITARTEVSAPNLFPEQQATNAYMRSTWEPVAGNVSYRLSRSTSEDGPFNSYVYIGTGTSHVETNLSQCTEYYYKLQSCNSTSGNALCSDSPVVSKHTLPGATASPSVAAISPNKIKVKWQAQDCADHYVVRRREQSGSRDYVYSGGSNEFIDTQARAGQTTQYQLIACPRDTSDLGNLCAYSSPYIAATTPTAKTDTALWEHHGSPSGPSNRGRFSQIVFNNKLWVIGGVLDTVNQNDVWSSDDGVTWELVNASAGFSERVSSYLVVHNSKMYLIGGRNNDGNYVTDVWSSSDGNSWSIETSSTGFQPRSGGGSAFSFNDKIWLIGGNVRNPDGSYAGAGSDIWSSVDGKIWQQHTGAAPFGGRSNHQVLEIDSKLYLYGGEGVPSGESIHITHDDIWSSLNGSVWVREKIGLPYGPREVHGMVEYAGSYWLLGGKENLAYEYSRDNSVDRMVPRTNALYQDDIWTSSDGLNWVKAYETSEWDLFASYAPINFNNKLWQVNTGPDKRWASTLGHVTIRPEGSLAISGAPVKGGTMQASLAGIVYNFNNSSALTYQWYKNEIKITGATAADQILNQVDVGDEIKLIVRYSNEQQELWQFVSDSVVIQANPIEVQFEFPSVVTNISQQSLSNALLNWQGTYSVTYSSSNTNVVTIAGANETPTITPGSVGSASLNATVLDSVSNASKSVQFNIEVGKGTQELSFPFTQLGKSDDSPVFAVTLAKSGSSSVPVTYTSSNTSVATVLASASSVNIQITGLGTTTIIATKGGDGSYLLSSASFVLNVYDGDLDGDGVADESDNCVNTPNTTQENLDNDTLGDSCDPDDDGDFVIDSGDCAPLDFTKWLSRNGFNDLDKDGIGAGVSISICSGQIVPSPYVELDGDNCPAVSNASQENYDADSEGNACDANDDNDSALDVVDCASLDETKWQLIAGYLDIDLDGIGFGVIDQICSAEMLPVDYVTSTNDNCQFDPNPNQINSDDDAAGDVCDDDDDNDLVLDLNDNCRTVANEDQLDENMNMIGDACELKTTDELCIPIKTLNGKVAIICL